MPTHAGESSTFEVIRVPARYLILLGALVFVSIVAVGQVRASDPAPAHVQAPLLKKTCRQIDACRRAVAWQERRRAKLETALAWQKRHARKQRLAAFKIQARVINDVTRDAIHWAAWKYGGGVDGQACARCAALERQMTGIGLCESHLWPWAMNGQYLSWAQLSGRHRSDPVIARLTWRDPYAVADHVARYLLRYGPGEWQCRPDGELRW